MSEWLRAYRAWKKYSWNIIQYIHLLTLPYIVIIFIMWMASSLLAYSRGDIYVFCVMACTNKWRKPNYKIQMGIFMYIHCILIFQLLYIISSGMQSPYTYSKPFKLILFLLHNTGFCVWINWLFMKLFLVMWLLYLFCSHCLLLMLTLMVH